MEERLHSSSSPSPQTDPSRTAAQSTNGEENEINPGDDYDPSSSNNHQQLIISPSQHEQPQPPRETYIIQFPKEQIYRVPPPANAEIVERYRKPEQKKKSRCCSLPCIILIFVLITIFCSALAVVYSLTLNPQTPDLAVKKLTVKPQRQLSNKDSINAKSVSYEVVLEAKNPNRVNKIRYEKGNVTLDYKGKLIGKSSPGFVAFDQDPREVHEVEVRVDGTVAKGGAGGLPKEVEESMKSIKVNKKIRLGLEMKVPLKMNTWIMIKKKEVMVACDFEVSSLAPNKDSKILSQECKTS